MAEVAGLALGSLAVLTLFKDCIELFPVYLDSKNLSRDFDISCAKLDIEKADLLEWASAARLDSPSSSSGSPRPRDAAIERGLGCIKALLEDVDALRDKYGVVSSAQNNGPTRTSSRVAKRRRLNTSGGAAGAAMAGGAQPQSTEQLHVRSGPHLRTFELAIRTRTDLAASTADTSIRSRTKWAVKDKKKFDSLLKDLNFFVEKLCRLRPPEQAPSASHASPGTDERRRECQKKILSLLRPLDEHGRRSVPPEHSRTCEWVLKPPGADEDWSDLSKWLRTGSGLYWINGKAGSGKSTLMSFLSRNSILATLLQGWANGEPLIKANFFFWLLGTEEQKSLEGLFRGLLYQILSAEPDLIEPVLPTVWDLMQSNQEHRVQSFSESLSVDDLRDMVLRAADSRSSGRLFFLIDGLDEFRGDARRAVDLVKELVRGDKAKVLVSSRPEPILYDAFAGKYPSLRMEDLNRRDIVKYIDDKIADNEHVESIRLCHQQEIDDLIEELRSKSSGVFLWVVLACTALLDGFAAGDRIEDLQKRAHALPSDLDKMFRHMILRIDPVHRASGARILRLVYLVLKHRVDRTTTFSLDTFTRHCSCDSSRPSDTNPGDCIAISKLWVLIQSSEYSGILSVHSLFRDISLLQDQVPGKRCGGVSKFVSWLHSLIHEQSAYTLETNICLLKRAAGSETILKFYAGLTAPLWWPVVDRLERLNLDPKALTIAVSADQDYEMLDHDRSKSRLRSKCGGLLVIDGARNDDYKHPFSLIHRSLYDFFDSCGTWEDLGLQVGTFPSGDKGAVAAFNIQWAIFYLCIATLQGKLPPASTLPRICLLARRLEKAFVAYPDVASRLFEQLAIFCETRPILSRYFRTGAHPGLSSRWSFQLKVAVGGNLFHLTQALLSGEEFSLVGNWDVEKELREEGECSLFCEAMRFFSSGSQELELPEPEVVRLLLAAGIAPGFCRPGCPGARRIAEWMKETVGVRSFHSGLFHEIAQMFLAQDS